MHPISFELYSSTRGTWDAMLKACSEAKKSIDIEQYIFQNDEIGSKFLEIFRAKVHNGVKVRMLIDMVGSYDFYASELPEELKKLGIEIRFFNKISPWRLHNFTSWFFRNHKKTLIIDGDTAFTGGTGIGFHMAEWRDTTARVHGESAREIGEAFNELWWFTEDRRLVRRINNLRKYKQKRSFITNSPYIKKRFLYYTFIETLRLAKKSIYLTTPYFIPDRRLVKVLTSAARRGVDVQIIVPKILDVPIVASASHSYYEHLLKKGVRIFKYQPKILHAKTAIVDGTWTSFGSFNLDSLSFLYNFEANIVTIDSKLVSEIENHFHNDISESKEILEEEWKNRGLKARVQEFFARSFSAFL